MLEIAFGEGVAGILAQVKASEKPCGLGEIYSLSLALDIGPIDDMDGDMASRARTLQTLYGDFEGVCAELWSAARRGIDEMRGAEKMRVWACETDPAEACGLCFACHMARANGAAVCVARPDALVPGEPRAKRRFSAGEMTLDDVELLSAREDALSALEIREYDLKWQALVKENAPLRAVVNGGILGVPASFYDFALRECMPRGRFRMVLWLGKTLARVNGVGDRWLFLRARSLCERGEAVEIAPCEGEYPYGALLERRRDG